MEWLYWSSALRGRVDLCIEGVELLGLKENMDVQSSVWMCLDGFWLAVRSVRRLVWWSFQVKRAGELGAKGRRPVKRQRKPKR